jgi:hypothetical protein
MTLQTSLLLVTRAPEGTGEEHNMLFADTRTGRKEAFQQAENRIRQRTSDETFLVTVPQQSPNLNRMLGTLLAYWPQHGFVVQSGTTLLRRSEWLE